MAKKVLSIALALLMIFNVFAVAVSAAESDKATITLAADGNPVPGDTIDVTVSLKTTYPVFALQMMIAYDSACYELVSAEGKVASGAKFASVTDSASLIAAAKEEKISVDANLGLLRIGYTWLPSEGATNAVAFNSDTAIATLKFKVKNGTEGKSGVIKVAPQFIVPGTMPSFDSRLATYVGKGTTTIADSIVNGQLYGNPIEANELSLTIGSAECKHTNVEVIPAVAATCSKTGLTEGKKCKDCGVVTVKQETVPVAAHTEVAIPAVAATCSKTGLTEGKKCSVCGVVTVKQNQTAKLPHTEATREENRVEATPVVDGSYDLVTYCTVCKEVLKREHKTIPATGHTAAAPVKENIKDSTCKTEGSYDLVVYCTCCTPKVEMSRTTETIAKKPHTEVDVPAKDATCTETGLTAGKKCSVCGTVTVAQETVDKLPHTEESAVTPPTCTDKGYTTYTCTVCGNERVSDYVDANGHTEEVLPAVPADCENTGLEEGKKCTVCGVVTVEQKVIPALGHKEATKEENRVEATEEVDGSYELVTYCTVCEKELDRETIVLPSWSNAKAHITTVISKNKVKADDIVTVTVKLSTNFHVNTLQLPVLFDETQFEVVGTTTNKNYLTFGDMFTSRNYNFTGRANKDVGFEYTSDADKWNTAEAKAQYGVAYITATYDGGLGNDDMTFAKPQGDVVATFQLKALKDVEDTSGSVFVSTDWAKTAENKRGNLAVNMIVEETYNPTTNTEVNFANVAYTSETIAIAGVTVSGTVTSFDDKIDNSDDVTITFTAEGSDAVYTATATGSGAQAYELTEVVAGTYTVTVSKANHVTRTYTVEVGDADVAQDLVIHLLGDINGDGKANTIDVARANNHAKSVTVLTDYAFDCANVSGDAKVNTIDVSRINQHAKGVSSLWK